MVRDQKFKIFYKVSKEALRKAKQANLSRLDGKKVSWFR